MPVFWDAAGLGLLTYVLSFAYLRIYWSNHHHLFQACERVDGVVLWANLALLFVLSLVPFTSSWMSESRLAATPVVVYGCNLLLAGTAYFLLEHAIARIPEQTEPIRRIFGRQGKETLSMALYLVGIALAAAVVPWAGVAVFSLVAVLWIIPDRRVERYLNTAD